MYELNIKVRNKIAAQTDKAEYVCGNSDYIAVFDFDSEWDAYDTKTARFSYNGSYTDVVFDGNQCPVPVITNTHCFHIGAYAGDLHTTTAARVPCRKSILCGGGSHVAPSEDVYNQLMQRMSELETPDWNQNDSTKKDYIKNRPGGYYIPQLETIELDSYDGHEGDVAIVVVDGKIAMEIDGETQEYAVVEIPEDPSIKIVFNEQFVLVIGSFYYQLQNTSDNKHVYSFKAGAPQKFSEAFMPDAVKHQIAFKHYDSSTKDVDVSKLVASVDVHGNYDLQDTLHRVLYDVNSKHLFVAGKFISIGVKTSVLMDSTLETQVVKNVFSSFEAGFAQLTLLDTHAKKSYLVFFPTNMDLGDTYLDGTSYAKCVQTVAYVGDHLFALTIDVAVKNRTFINGDLTIRRLI